MKATAIRLTFTEDNKPEISLALDLPRRQAWKYPPGLTGEIPARQAVPPGKGLKSKNEY